MSQKTYCKRRFSCFLFFLRIGQFSFISFEQKHLTFLEIFFLTGQNSGSCKGLKKSHRAKTKDSVNCLSIELIDDAMFVESLRVSDAVDFLSVLKTLLPHLPAGALESSNDSDSDNSDEEDSVVIYRI